MEPTGYFGSWKLTPILTRSWFWLRPRPPVKALPQLRKGDEQSSVNKHPILNGVYPSIVLSAAHEHASPHQIHFKQQSPTSRRPATG